MRSKRCMSKLMESFTLVLNPFVNLIPSKLNILKDNSEINQLPKNSHGKYLGQNKLTLFLISS